MGLLLRPKLEKHGSSSSPNTVEFSTLAAARPLLWTKLARTAALHKSALTWAMSGDLLVRRTSTVVLTPSRIPSVAESRLLPLRLLDSFPQPRQQRDAPAPHERGLL